MSQPGPESQNLSQQLGQRSFKKANHLQKTNQVLSQVIEYFEHNPSRLEEEGIIRISSAARHINDFKKKFMVDPVANPFKAVPAFHNSGIDVMNYAKAVWQDLPDSWNPTEQVKSIFKSFSDGEPPQDINGLIEKLVKNGAVEEAQLIHNFIYLGKLVASKEAKNKMNARNVAIVFAPSLAGMFQKVIPAMDPLAIMALSSKLQEPLQTALEDPNHEFDKVFAKTPKYQASANDLAKRYLQDIETFPPISSPRKILGIKVPAFLNKILDAIKLPKISMPGFLKNLFGGKKPAVLSKEATKAKLAATQADLMGRANRSMRQIRDSVKLKVPPKPTDPPPAPPKEASAQPAAQETTSHQADLPPMQGPVDMPPPSELPPQPPKIKTGIKERIEQLQKLKDNVQNPLAGVQKQDIKELGDAVKGKVGKMIDVFDIAGRSKKKAEDKAPPETKVESDSAGKTNKP